jgi:hypothetical protein
MQDHPISRRRRRAFPLALALVVCVASRPVVSIADDRDAGSPSAGGGFKVHVDPQTGRFLETPPPQAGTGTAPQPAATAPVIDVQPSTVPGGGYGFRVPESLHAEIKATTTPDGKTHVECGEAQK